MTWTRSSTTRAGSRGNPARPTRTTRRRSCSRELLTAAYYDDVVAEPRLGEASVRSCFHAAGTRRREPRTTSAWRSTPGSRASSPPTPLRPWSATAGREHGNRDGRRRGLLRAAGPAFAELSREDESKFRARSTASAACWEPALSAMLKVYGPAMKSSLPPPPGCAHRGDEAQRPRFLQRQTHRNLEWLDRYGLAVSRLCHTGPGRRSCLASATTRTDRRRTARARGSST